MSAKKNLRAAVGIYTLSISALATGVALLVYFLAGVSLPLSVFLTVGVACGAGYSTWRRLNPRDRKEVLGRVRVGLICGVVATAGYDVSRYLLVKIAGYSIWPYDTFKLFGQLLLGEGVSADLAWVAGTTFHAVNGLSFAVAYTILLGDRGWKTGIVWAMGLELVMVCFYPGWLGLKVLDEFLNVSITGHLIYGVLLGWLSRRLLNRRVSESPA